MHQSIRKMEVKDLPHVMSIVKTYEHDEYIEWLEVSDNIFLVCELEGKIKGFVLCFLMSSTRALLDVMFSNGGYWNGGSAGTYLVGALDEQLLSKGIKYIGRQNLTDLVEFKVVE